MSKIETHNKANKLKNKGQLEKAKELYKSNSDFYLSQFEFSSCLILQEQYEEAENYIKETLEKNSENFYLHFNLAILYKRKCLYKKALEHIDYFLRNKQTPEAEFIKSEILLSIGDQFGIYLYEERLKCSNYKIKKIPKKRKFECLTPEIKEITVISEGGYGDIIMFSRYLLLLINKGIVVTLVCSEPLIDLMGLLHKDIIVTSNYKFSKNMCYIMSLPKILGKDYNSSFCGRYINVCEDRENYWESKISNSKNIGIAWKGGDVTKRYRDLDTKYLDKIKFEGFVVYSLQKGDKNIPKNIIDYTKEFYTFLDTASFINTLDLVITIDTSIAHLAGALGKEVILLLSYNHCWRWNYSLYPKIRIIKQKEIGKWDYCIEELNDLILEYK